MRGSLVIALGLALAFCDGHPDAPARPPDVPGRYVFAGAVAATLEITAEGDHYVVALSGGSPTDSGGAAPADCYVRATGTLRNDTLDAAFGSVDRETFTYSPTRAAREGRRLRIVFRRSGPEVTRADTDGYCGLGATFVGPYRREK